MAAPRRRISLRGAVRRARLVLALSILALVVGSALLAPWIAPFDPNAMDLGNALQPPSAEHWFGTDQLGRDVFSRAIVGGQLSLLIAAAVVALAGTSGTLLGIVAGYRGGWIDGIIMRVADIQYALPPVILAMVMVGAIGPSTTNIVAVITLANWARFARVIRAEALSLRHRDFVLLARLAGASHLRIVLVHILPNVRNTLLVLLTLDLGLIIILEATLSFLGLGIQPPDPSWGTMIADGRGYLERAWWTSILPGCVLMLTVLAANLLGDSLRAGNGSEEAR
ncbi:peptide/nickel transport system permease protein [Azospirillum agricola]|uniref:ABC transporter permease n=1 Tax=Azospirillum agricola TaxID=1720247 RepID=UPI001AE31E08|nr:ABC transporter permease [Azospirillum agricola]MBP2231872.1 peptide/nickel transport system permease protein [Azospirillum agricola]